MDTNGNNDTDKQTPGKLPIEPKTAARLSASASGETISRAIDVEIGNDEVFVWPKLVYKELLAAMFIIILFWLISLFVDAPLGGVANPTHSPNPAKAPWYFVGLQELLVYFDPWIAGVMTPALIVIGLMAIPYLDVNRSATGIYSFSQRKFAITIFTLGLTMWFLLITVGSFLRGPNWGWYWPWQSWAETRMIIPTRNLPNVLGFFLVLVYFGTGIVIPRKIYPNFFKQLGATRYVITMVFVLLMFSILGKIFLRLIFNVKYVLVTPWFNL